MDSDKLIKDALLQTSDLVNYYKPALIEIKKKFDETEQLIFDKTCFKRDHLNKCETSLCGYFNDNTCKYPVTHSQLKLMLKDFTFQ